MHGQVKKTHTEAEKAKRKKEQDAKVKAYKEGISKVLHKRSLKEHDDEALTAVEDILCANPDVYTCWNFRKEILLTYKENKTKEELTDQLLKELRLTEICLKQNPKSYGAWFHRLWLMDNMPEPNLKLELDLCTKYLKLDERNFHCWDYRREIVAKLGLSPEEELKYTTTKICENFSNYSSWHYRSKLLPLVHPDPDGKRPVQEAVHEKELELVQNAAFTDPDDQSGWFYMRWLLGATRGSPTPTLAMAALAPSTAYLVFTLPVSPHLVTSSFAQSWRTLDLKLQSHVLVCDLNENSFDEASATLMVDLGGHQQEIELKQEKGGWHYWTANVQFSSQLGTRLVKVLEEQLTTTNQLLDMEPDSKWTLFTSALLMQAIDKKRYKEEIMERLAKLIKVDHYRQTYYHDLRSRLLIEEALENMEAYPVTICLKQLELTTLYHTHYLLLAPSLNLSHNKLSSSSLIQLYPLQTCKVLILDNNNITSLKGFPVLQSLTTLSIKDNQITCTDDITRNLKPITTLIALDITGNPVNNNDNVLKDIVQMLRSLKLINAEMLQQ